MSKYTEWTEKINKCNIKDDFSLDNIPPHCSNLLHQLSKQDVRNIDLFENIMELYLKVRTIQYGGSLKEYVINLVNSVNNYMDFFKIQNPFSHQADFTSSIIPEMFYLIFSKMIKLNKLELVVSAQKDLSIECIFDISDGGKILFKHKKVDIAILKQCVLSFNKQESIFMIPLVAIEAKTNLDKNMISGIEHSVTALKQTFPKSFYYVITELSDFDVSKSNYASSGIDEIYVLRRQKRATVRNNKASRQEIDISLILEIAQKVDNAMKLINQEQPVNIVQKMQEGKLIGR